MAWLAILFSLMAPGAGQIFVGEFTLGVLYGALFSLGKSALLPLCLRLFKITTLKRTLQFFYVCNWGYILLIFYATASAFFQAHHAEKKYFLATLIFVICVRLVQKQTFNNFIFTTLCGRNEIWEILQKTRSSSTDKIQK